jgi:hypothetical protein
MAPAKQAAIDTELDSPEMQTLETAVDSRLDKDVLNTLG